MIQPRVTVVIAMSSTMGKAAPAGEATASGLFPSSGVTPPVGVDDTDGDYLVGVGADIALSDRMGLRLAADTIAFDSTRLTAGVTWHF